jgi:hypothetical protein
MSTQPTSATAPSAQETTEQPLSRDDVFHLLQSARRRGVVRYLSERDEDAVCEMRDIAAQVAAWENGKPITQLDSDERQRVYISLYQGHLPTLNEKGIIEYNQSRGRVEPTPLLNQLEAYVMSDADSEEQSTSPKILQWCYRRQCRVVRRDHTGTGACCRRRVTCHDYHGTIWCDDPWCEVTRVPVSSF